MPAKKNEKTSNAITATKHFLPFLMRLLSFVSVSASASMLQRTSADKTVSRSLFLSSRANYVKKKF